MKVALDHRGSQKSKELDKVVEDHEGRLFAFIRKRIENTAEAEDLLQDVFEELSLSEELLETFEEVGAWLMTVARNKIFDRFRKRRSERNYAQATEAEPLPESQRAEARPDDESIRSELRTEILAAIEDLPPEQARVFVMHELEGKSFQEISEETGVSLNTLLSRKRYAMESLREYLKEVYDEFKF